ncbi:hypothetical protein BFW01_g7105 [Lasiodiplodia theobromae]|uniref:COX assembly mitochondrial protein n=1 Tax=Lasiodiplodia theobromae TaxID=45133 RepID=A0A5N5DER1_9PEZI|nr:Cytochrome c oxidase biogenesis protein cmc1-like [Lasiodiplodia theobromae]KAB2576117.1 hypothetical protein DBV05_g5226 [Lasiodiplodia theobromae]KAF4545659.1 Cytochrome c oxidase biogenesis protein cmc1-like [Lasiodiplodia theobromae]KAF9636210.1 hypothetical protein BFW01_g7105 [Lasiodiplodia theobromae]
MATTPSSATGAAKAATVAFDKDAVPRDPVPRNPVPLSAGQEQQVRDLYHKRVRQKCADEVKEFASCALNRTISATWACRQQRLAMNNCMVAHATQEEQDRAREEWFATRELRKREREEKERKRIEQEKFHREWWGLDDEGKRKFEKK